MKKKYLKKELEHTRQQLQQCRQHNAQLRSELNIRKMMVFEMDEKERAWQEQASSQQASLLMTVESVAGSDLKPGEHHVQIKDIEIINERHTYRVYADGSVVHEDDFDELPEDGSDDFEVISVPVELIDHIREDGTWQCKKCHRRVNAISYTSLCNDCNVQGDESLQEATKTDNPFIDEGYKKAIEEQARGRSFRELHENQPVRPSEDDMMSKPKFLPTSCISCGIAMQVPLDSPPLVACSTCASGGKVNTEQTTTHDQHPQFRDIGVRIDRYGKLVFKPELEVDTGRIDVLEKVLHRIVKWHGEFPLTETIGRDGKPLSYGACYGSNGERDYMREIASKALKK